MKELEKEILEESLTKDDREYLEAHHENAILCTKKELKELIQITCKKIIQIIDKRIEKLTNELKSDDYYDTEKQELRHIIIELQSLKKEVELWNKKQIKEECIAVATKHGIKL